VTTGSGGCVAVCLDALGGAGSYQVTVSESGYYPYSNTLSLSCGGTTTVKLLPTSGNPSIKFTVTGCCSQPLPNALVTIAGATYTTDSSGQVMLGLTDAGTYTWSVSKARFVTQTGSFTITACDAGGKSLDVLLLAASGYVCGIAVEPQFPYALADPIPTTLNLTDSVYGSTTITYNAGTHSYSGTLAVAATPVKCGCPTSATVITYTLQSVGTCAPEYESGFPYHAFGGVPCPFTTAIAGNETLPAGVTYTFTQNPTIPFDWSVTYPVDACSFGASGVGTLFLYPAGGTITITE